MMGLAGAKRSKCPRVLSPFEIEGQRHDGDNLTNPLLVAWYDFNDNTENLMFSFESGYSDNIEDGQRLGFMYNKVWRNIRDNGAPADLDKALFGYILGVTGTMAPYWHAPTSNSRGFVRFNGTTNALFGGGTTPSVAGNCSSSTIDMNDFMLVIVAKKDDSVTGVFQYLFTLYPKSGNQLISVTYGSSASPTSDTLTITSVDTGGGTPIRTMNINSVDDGEFRYYYINAYPSYVGGSNSMSMNSDGFYEVGTPTYNHFSLSAAQTSTMEFDGVSGNMYFSLGAGKASGTVYPDLSSGLFKGDIYEMMIFKKDMVGGALPGLDPGADRRTVRDVTHYLRRKYGYIRNID